MKTGEIKKVARRFAGLFPAPWRCIRNEMMRRDGDWIQIVAFNAHRYAEEYVPRNCMEFLKMPGPPTGSFLVQELRHPNGVQRWVRLSEPPELVFSEMVGQFRPRLLAALELLAIRRLLADSRDYWPHPYALCVMACEEGNELEARRWFDAFVSATAGKPYPWVETRRRELDECVRGIAVPELLRRRLEAIRAEKLSALKWE